MAFACARPCVFTLKAETLQFSVSVHDLRDLSALQFGIPLMVTKLALRGPIPLPAKMTEL
jgi:hypothetical protein